MKKQLLFLVFVLCVVQFSSQAQKTSNLAPVSDDFKEYLKLKKRGEYPQSGYIPSPSKPNFDYFMKNFDKKKIRGSLPKSYDLRDYDLITRVKEQGDFGTCWTFSNLGAVESYWKKIGLSEYDLSEKHLATCNGFLWHFSEDGGNSDIATAYLTRRQGPVLERDDPYYTLNKYSKCAEDKTPVAYVDQKRSLPSDHDVIKQYIMNYGAIATTIRMGGLETGNEYYNPIDYTFYNNGTLPIDHGVLVIGWDDNKKVTGGTRTPHGKHRGAWIVKNSWGQKWGDHGFFYVSYKDTKFLSSNVIYPSRGEYKADEKIYLYDELGMINSYKGENNIAYGLAKFETPASEFITKVGTFIIASGAKIDIEIYKNFDPESGELSEKISAVYDQVCDLPGYYSFDIPAPVNGVFYVKVKYYTPGYNYPLPVETKYEGYAEPTLEKGVNWYSTDGLTWEATGEGTEYEIDLCIRAYTQPYEQPVAFFTANKKQACVESEITFTENSYGDILEYIWDFGKDATPQTITTNEANKEQKVSYSTAGEKIIKLTVKGSGTSSVLEKKLNIVDGNLNLLSIVTKNPVILGKTAYLLALGDADSFVWSPKEHLDTVGGNKVLFTPPAEGKYSYTVTGTQGSCTGEAKISFPVYNAPENDDAANAIELDYTKNGPFTNKYATVEDNEPYADTTLAIALEHGSDEPCNSQYTWCHEGGLHNSVWFKVKAKESGVLSIDSYGMDNQIAVYDAETPDDLFVPGKFTMLAANDDYHDEAENYSAAILPLNGLTPGKYYWIQVDGSAGGTEGEFELFLYHGALSVPDVDLENRITLYPNPTKGTLNIKLYPNLAKKMEIRISDMQGRTVYVEELDNVSSGIVKTIDLKTKAKGIYNVQFVFDKQVVNKKIVIE
ncbi:MAG: hypothetical protein CSA05_01350 [Bacteroidia bacterium]|nr:MAG: hypothetical protein CSA05_01350 [Bacteroidia bacterium]